MPIEKLTGRQAIVFSLKELMEKGDLDRISVTNICNNCGINRQIFYYYFKDKYDVVNYIFRTKQNEALKSALKDHSWGETIVSAALAIIEEKRFYINAFRASDVNSLSEYLFDYAFQVVQSIVLSQLETDTLDDLQQYILRQYIHGIVGILKEWYVKDGMKQSPQLIAECIVANTPSQFKKYFETVKPEFINYHYVYTSVKK